MALDGSISMSDWIREVRDLENKKQYKELAEFVEKYDVDPKPKYSSNLQEFIRVAKAYYALGNYERTVYWFSSNCSFIFMFAKNTYYYADALEKLGQNADAIWVITTHFDRVFKDDNNIPIDLDYYYQLYLVLKSLADKGFSEANGLQQKLMKVLDYKHHNERAQKALDQINGKPVKSTSSSSYSSSTATPKKGSFKKILIGSIIVLALAFGFDFVRDLISKPKTAKATTQTEQTATTSQNVNFRTSPSTDSDIIVQIPQGETVTITGDTENGWTPIEYKNNKGWVSSEYIKQ